MSEFQVSQQFINRAKEDAAILQWASGRRLNVLLIDRETQTVLCESQDNESRSEVSMKPIIAHIPPF